MNETVQSGQTQQLNKVSAPSLFVCVCVCVCACVCVLWANSHSVTQPLSVSEPCLLLVAPRPPLLSAACRLLPAGRTGADPSRPVPCSLLPVHGADRPGGTRRRHGGHSWPAAASTSPGARVVKVRTEVTSV